MGSGASRSRSATSARGADVLVLFCSADREHGLHVIERLCAEGVAAAALVAAGCQGNWHQRRAISILNTSLFLGRRPKLAHRGCVLLLVSPDFEQDSLCRKVRNMLLNGFFIKKKLLVSRLCRTWPPLAAASRA
jgi:hypothetical protein